MSGCASPVPHAGRLRVKSVLQHVKEPPAPTSHVGRPGLPRHSMSVAHPASAGQPKTNRTQSAPVNYFAKNLWLPPADPKGLKTRKVIAQGNALGNRTKNYLPSHIGRGLGVGFQLAKIPGTARAPRAGFGASPKPPKKSATRRRSFRCVANPCPRAASPKDDSPGQRPGNNALKSSQPRRGGTPM